MKGLRLPDWGALVWRPQLVQNEQDCVTTIHETRLPWFGECLCCATALMASTLTEYRALTMQ